MGCWFTFLSLFLLFGIGMVAVASGPERWTGLTFILIPLLMLVIGGGMVWLGRMHGRADREAILAFLTATIGARPFQPHDL